MKALTVKLFAMTLGRITPKQYEQIWTWMKEAAIKTLTNQEKMEWVVGNLVDAVFGPNQKWMAQGVVQLIFIWAKMSGLLDDKHQPTKP